MRFSLFHLFLSLSHLSVFFAAQPCSDFQKSALLTLFSDRSSLPSWKSNGSDCCRWEGVTCDRSTGHVTVLDISGRSISSSINSTAFTSLSSLRVLNLSNNNFSSPIPSSIGSLSNLAHLNLSDSGFTGQIPLAVSRLKSLVSLDISTSYLDSPLTSLKLEDPDLETILQNLSLLEELHLDGVNISSTVPEFLSNFTNLRCIHLSNCRLRGVFPGRIFLLPKLQALDLSGNLDLSGSFPEFSQESDLQELAVTGTGFSGRLPDSLGYLRKLTKLQLASCNFSGFIPSAVRNITGIVRLDLSWNSFSGQILPLENLSQLVFLDLSWNNFSGPIPPLVKFTKLNYLDLSLNYFSGPISSLVKFTKLNYLDLSVNDFSGQIPSLNSLKNITKIVLSNNNLTGTISVDGLQNLKEFNVRNNSLQGKIPSSLFTLPSLQSLDLSQNHFNGTLDEFDNASQMLETLDLSSNNLQGQIPMSVFNLSALKLLDLSSNNFSGPVEIAMLQSFKNLSNLDLSDNLLSIDIPANNSSSFPSIDRLRLRSCNLTGFPDFLRNQTKLDFLDLSNNRIRGEIPSWIWTLGNESLTYLNLSFNLLTSFERSQNHSFGSLAILDLRSNKLQGSIPLPPPENIVIDYSNNSFTSLPDDFGSYLNFTIFFSISGNSIKGKIPKSICNANASYLEVLDLSNNKLSGAIPECLGEISTVLSVLNLRNNGLSGIIPEIFNEGCNLRTLNFNGNRLSGQLPKSLTNCTRLEVLDFGNNQIHDQIPSYWNALPELRVLVLRENEFYGPIMQFSNFTFPMLQIIDLSSNNLSGKLPKICLRALAAMKSWEDHQVIEYGFLDLTGLYYRDMVMVISKGLAMELVKILTIFTSLDLSNNNFEGAIPEVLGTLNSLRVLNMSRNGFSGSIPASIGNLTQLESLDLSENRLSGVIPSELIRLTFLEVLNLSYNQLNGPIPQERQFLTFSNESYNGNPGLCDPPLSRTCDSNAPPPSALPTESAVVDSSGGGFDWELIFIGLGFGGGLGMIAGPLVFWKKGRKWYNNQIDRLALMILPSCGFCSLHCNSPKIEAEEQVDQCCSETTTDSGGEEEESNRQFCVFCTQVDSGWKKVIHKECSCHDILPPFSSQQSQKPEATPD